MNFHTSTKYAVICGYWSISVDISKVGDILGDNFCLKISKFDPSQIKKARFNIGLFALFFNDLSIALPRWIIVYHCKW